jgi:hypothetical protein
MTATRIAAARASLPRFRQRPRLWLTLGLVALVIALGVTVVAIAPVGGGGDYGQWLMAARPFRGEEVPAYRNLTALPPVIPVVLAAYWTVFGDPQLALRVLDLTILALLVGGFALAAFGLFRRREAAFAGPVAGLLVIDRFGELFAFGGLLQLAAVATSLIAFGAFALASDGRPGRWRAWLIGAVALATMAMTHVGTAEVLIPTGLGLATLAALRVARLRGWRAARPALLVPLLLAPVAAYWLLVLLPTNGGYLANPAAASYRGVDAFLRSLTGYLPNVAVMVAGALALAVGVGREAWARRLGPWGLLAAWTGAVWTAFALVAVSGAGTDYLRFATLLTPPLAIAAGGGVAYLTRTVAAGMRRGAARREIPLLLIALLATLLLPTAAGRAASLASFYTPIDGVSLRAAVSGLEEILGERPGAVLASVRVGKWLEGLTGRAALFSQPVRYAFRSGEWQRSLDAEVLTHATIAIANPAFLVEYQRATSPAALGATDLVIAINHDGEWTRILRTIARDTSLLSPSGRHPLEAFVPDGITAASADPEVAAMVSTWRDPSRPQQTFQRTVSLTASDPTILSIIDVATAAETIRLYPAPGITMSSVVAAGNGAIVCFSTRGSRPPCVRLSVADPGGAITPIGDGGLWVRSSRPGAGLQIEALTTGAPIVDLQLLEPNGIAEDREVVGAILERFDPGFEATLERLALVGFRPVRIEGQYELLVRDAPLTGSQ